MTPPPHPTYLALGHNTSDRHQAYRTLVQRVLDSAELQAIRTYLQHQHALGSSRFQAAIEAQLARAQVSGKCNLTPFLKRRSRPASFGVKRAAQRHHATAGRSKPVA